MRTLDWRDVSEVMNTRLSYRGMRTLDWRDASEVTNTCLSYRGMRTLDWREVSEATNTCLSYRGPGFGFQHPRGSSQPSVCESVPGNLRQTSSLCGHQIHK